MLEKGARFYIKNSHVIEFDFKYLQQANDEFSVSEFGIVG